MGTCLARNCRMIRLRDRKGVVDVLLYRSEMKPLAGMMMASFKT